MRIISLLPACTEWVAAFGGLGDLVGRSHVCDYPDAVRALPILTHPIRRQESLAAGDGSDGADDGSRRRLLRSLSPFHVDVDLLAELEPDVVLTQTQCEVCAVTEAQLVASLSQLMDPMPDVFSFRATTMKEVLDRALALGRVINRSSESMKAIAGLESRLRALRDRLGLHRSAPAVATAAALEWMEPLMTAGHWVPDLIESAGGRPVCASGGSQSEKLDWELLREADPDVIAVMPCSMDLLSARQNVHQLTRRKGWFELRAVRRGRAFLIDGSAYFNRPGPRLYRSIELLAAAIHGKRAGIAVRPHEMSRLAS